MATSTEPLKAAQFLEMEQAFGPTGGFIVGDEVERRMRECSRQPISSQPISILARWMAERRAVSIVWQAQTLFPLFQFDRSNMTLRPSVTATVAELKEVFDDWDLALWFASPNAWLFDCVPVDVIDIDDRAVLHAAWVDRSIALD